MTFVYKITGSLPYNIKPQLQVERTKRQELPIDFRGMAGSATARLFYNNSVTGNDFKSESDFLNSKLVESKSGVSEAL